jgi:hypothetical protein
VNEFTGLPWQFAELSNIQGGNASAGSGRFMLLVLVLVVRVFQITLYESLTQKTEPNCNKPLF